MHPEKLEHTDSLEEQFSNKEVMELPGGKVEVVDIKPDKEKDEVPTLVAPGWAATPEVLKDNILTLAEEGRRTISINSPHGIETQKVENFPEAELKKVAAVMEVLKEKKIDKIDAVAHSEAGINIAIAATLYPEKFRNIVLVDPGGMVGEDNLGRLIKDFSNDIVIKQTMDSLKDPERIKPIVRALKEAGKSILAGPKETVKEVLAISKTQIHELLKGLKEQGIGITIIHGVDDRAFPMDKVQKIAKMDQLDGFISVKGTHNEFYLKPKVYTRLADQALTALAAKKDKT